VTVTVLMARRMALLMGVIGMSKVEPSMALRRRRQLHLRRTSAGRQRSGERWSNATSAEMTSTKSPGASGKAGASGVGGGGRI
jgi:hypothetical protein